MSRSTASAALLFLALGSCRTPTQVTLTVYTELPCDPASPPRTLIRVGVLGALKGKPATVDSTACVGGRVGSLVVVPSGDKSGVVGIEVVTREGGNPTTCDDQSTDEAAFKGCIFARRALAFVPHSELELPIDLRLACLGKKCDPSQTCVDGSCEDAYIRDSSVCYADTCRRDGDGGVEAGDGGGDTPASDTGPDATDVIDADAPTPTGAPWARAAGPLSGIGAAVAVAKDGNIFGGFTFQGTATYERSLSAAALDTALVKYSASGAVLWSRQLGGDSDEIVSSVHVHPSGDVLVLGRTESGTFRPEGGSAIPSPGGSGLYLARYTAAGALVFARRYIGGGEYAHWGGAALNASGDLVIAQTVSTAVEWDGTSHPGTGDLNVGLGIFAAKDGTASNVAVLSGPVGSQTLLGAMVLGKDGPFLVGQFSDTFAGLPKAQAADGFVLALDNSFKQRWAFSTVDVGAPDTQQFGAVALTSGGDVFVVGASQADKIRIAGNELSGAGALAVQFDAAGAFVRGQVFPTGSVVTPQGSLDVPMALALGPGGDLTFVATTVGDATAPPFSFDGKLASLTLRGAGDLLLVQLTTSSAGIVATRQRLFGDAAAQASGRLVRTADGDVVLAGTYAGAMDLGVTPALPAGGSGQSFVARLKP